jgi:hypothetical protein
MMTLIKTRIDNILVVAEGDLFRLTLEIVIVERENEEKRDLDVMEVEIANIDEEKVMDEEETEIVEENVKDAVVVEDLSLLGAEMILMDTSKEVLDPSLMVDSSSSKKSVSEHLDALYKQLIYVKRVISRFHREVVEIEEIESTESKWRILWPSRLCAM